MPNQVTPNLPEDKELAKMIVQSHTRSIERRQDIGKMGDLFGSRDNAVVYLAAAVILISILAGSILAIWEPTARADLIKALAALAISALGFIFGSIKRNNDKS